MTARSSGENRGTSKLKRPLKNVGQHYLNPKTRSYITHTLSFSHTAETKLERVLNFVLPATCRLREWRMYKRDWARVHATYSKRLELMISLGQMMTGDFMKLTFLPQCLHSCRMETSLGPLNVIC